MRRTLSTSKTITDENPFSLSLGDLMAGLLLIFYTRALFCHVGFDGEGAT